MLDIMLKPRASTPGPTDNFWYTSSGSRTSAGINVSEESALTYSAVWAATRLLSETTAGLPLPLYRRISNGGREQVTDDPRHLIANTQSSENITAYNFRRTIIQQQINAGNGFAEIERRGSGRFSDVVALHPICSSRVRQDPATTDLRYLVRNKDGSDITLQPWEMLHLCGAIPKDGIWGRGVVNHGRQSIGFGLATEKHGAEFFGSGAKNIGMITTPGIKDKPQRDAMRAEWREIYQNNGDVGFFPPETKFEALGFSNEDAQFLETRQHNISEIARWYGVPPHMLAELSRCMPASTLVYTAAGPKRIVDVAIGEDVWSIGDNGLEISRVVNRYENGVRDIIELKTTNRTVRCTPTHKLLVRRRVYLDSIPGQRGGKSINGKKMRVEWRNEYVPAGELREGDMLLTLEGTPDTGHSVAPNGRKLTKEFMEFCGLLVGDGNIHRNAKKKPTHVSIARSSKASYMPHYREAARKEFIGYVAGTNYHNRSAVATKPVHLYESERATHFASVLGAGELSELGFSGTAFTKTVPAWVFGVSDELKLAFLRGFLDSDGTVDCKGRITFYSANQFLLDQFRHLCMDVGIPVTNRRSDVNAKPAPASKVYVPTRMWRFTCSDPGANRRIGSHDTRYVERFAQGKPFDKKDRKYPMFGGNVGLSGLASAKIVSISHLPAEPTFDLEVSGTHSFIADGVASHNSTNNNIENQSLHFVIYSLMPWIRSGEQTLNMRLLSPSEQRDMFFEHTLNGLLRGDQKSRYESYKVALGNGFMTINEVRRLENLNPIGPEGDVNYVPMNMTTAERMLSNEFTRPQPAAKSTPDSEQAFDAWTRNALKQATMPAKSARRILRAVNRISERLSAMEAKPEPQSTAPSDKQLDAARGVLCDALSRMYRKEANEAIRAAGKPESFLDWMEAFYAKHEPLMSEAIAPAKGMFAALGVSIGSESASCNESKQLLSSIYDTATKDEFSSKVSACVASWPTDRAETFSRLLTEQPQ